MHSSSAIRIPQTEDMTCQSGKLKTEFTSPIAKSTSPGLSDTTFFACRIYRDKGERILIRSESHILNVERIFQLERSWLRHNFSDCACTFVARSSKFCAHKIIPYLIQCSKQNTKINYNRLIELICYLNRYLQIPQELNSSKSWL